MVKRSFKIICKRNTLNNDWNHCAVEQYTNAGATRTTVYLNGVAVGQSNGPNGYDAHKDSTGPIIIGTDPRSANLGDTYSFNGQIQDVRIYKGIAKYKGGFDVAKPYTPKQDASVGIDSWRTTSDTVTNNFATFNPIPMVPAASIGVAFSNGNLTLTGSAAYRSTPATMGMHSGKWYVEFYWNTWLNDCHLGIMNDLSPNITGTWAGTTAPGYAWAGSGGRLYNNGSIFGSFLHQFGTGDICQIAFDADNGALYFSKNGTWQNSGDPTSGSSATGAAFTGLTDTPANFSGAEGRFVKVNAGGTALEFVTSSAASTAFNDLTDVTATGAAQGDVIYYNGSAWVTQNGPTMRWSIGANGSSDYTFSGPGFPTTTNDPVLYLNRGHTYIFVNTTGTTHPFEIRTSNNGSAYTSGVSGSQSGTQVFTVPVSYTHLTLPTKA